MSLSILDRLGTRRDKPNVQQSNRQSQPDSFMIHIAINTGKTCWLEEAQDEEYMRGIWRRMK
jgi:hypothetical protein